MSRKNKTALSIPLLREGLGPFRYAGEEKQLAEAMFAKFVSEGFRYEEISNHPDYPVYASAELLIWLLPQMIDEMLRKEDTSNFLIYPMISSIDPAKSDSDFNKSRIDKLMSLADAKFAQSICRFIEALMFDPPNSDEQILRLMEFWGKRAGPK